MKNALVVEHDDALGRWLCAVLGENAFGVDWCRSLEQARHRLAEGARPDVVVVEAVMEGAGAEFSNEVKTAGITTVLLIPRGASVLPDVADRILEHPVNRALMREVSAFVESRAGDDATGPEPEHAVATTPPAPASVTAEAEPARDKTQAMAEDRLRLGKQAMLEGRLEAALIDLEASRALSPPESPAVNLIPWVRYARVRRIFVQAAAHRDRVLNVADDSDVPELVYYGATVAFDDGQLERAETFARRVLELDPNHGGAEQLLVVLRERQ